MPTAGESPMTYVEGFVVAVRTANKHAYRNHADGSVPTLKRLAASRLPDGCAEDVPRGTANDVCAPADARPDETVLFSWIEYPDRVTRDEAGRKMMEDPAMQDMPEMPFDAKRMIWSGFEVVHEAGLGGKP